MATRLVSRSLFTTKQAFSSVMFRSYASLSHSSPPPAFSTFSIFRLRQLAAFAAHFHLLSPSATGSRGFSTRQTSSSLNDPNPNWSNRPPKETILLDGCDFEHWLVVMEKPQGDPTRDEIIDSYIKTLAKVVGSEEEARMKIYSVSTRHYYAFGALVSEELSYKLKELEGVRWVLPDSYLDVKNKDYGGEPFINGQAVPYDPKYHEEWVRNNARANERNRRNDRPRNFDRSRNFERRRENMQNRDFQNPGSNMGGPPPSHAGGAPNMGGPPGNYGGQPHMNPPPNMGGMPPNTGRAPPNMGGMPPNVGGGPNNPQNFQYGGGPNSGGMPPPGQHGYAPNAPGSNPYQPQNAPGGNPYQPQNPSGGTPGGTPYQAQQTPGGNPYQARQTPGGNPYQAQQTPGGNPYQAQQTPGSNPYQSQNMPGMPPPPPNYQ